MIPRFVSSSGSPSRAMRPSCGRSSPAMALRTVLLPQPEGPNSAVTPSARGLEGGVEREVAEAVPQRDLQHQLTQWPGVRPCTCGAFALGACRCMRAISSASIRPHMASVKEMSASRAAVASPPGVWVAA
jgi:hypothetical protein